MSGDTLPTLFISHGGGPWPFMQERLREFAATAQWLRELAGTLPAPPRAILSVSGHWEESRFTVASAEHPPMVYDYYGFPPHTYRVRYPAPGSPELAQRVLRLLDAAGIEAAEDPRRGFDHGTFVPLVLMYPQAQVPVVSLSLQAGLEAQRHIRMGEALAPLRTEGVLIMGSGLSYHNLHDIYLGNGRAGAVSEQFEHWLTDTLGEPDSEQRNRRLARWDQAPLARLAHPRAEHLMPLMVAAGAAGRDGGYRAFLDHVWGVAMASYRFGA